MDNDSKRKNKFDNLDFRKFIAIIIPVVAGSLLVVVFAISVMARPDYRDIDGSLAIITLAVTVWTGINIANVIEKSEVEKIRRKLKSAEARIKQSEVILKQSEDIINDLNKNKEMREDIDRKEFLYVLESSNDIFYRYLHDLYKEELKRNVIPWELNVEALRLIKGILHIRALHEKGTADTKKHIFDYSKELIDRIEKLSNDMQPCLTRQVLQFTKYEAYFYSAFARYEYGDIEDKYSSVAERFYTAANGYEKLMRNFLIQAPDIIVCHYSNIVAQCYSEILFCYIKVKSDPFAAKKIESIVNLDLVRKKVLEHSKRATENESLRKFPFAYERFHKNFGVANERIALAFDEDYLSYLKSAIAEYELADERGKQKKTGYVLCSGYNKYIKKLINPQNIEFITPECKVSLWQEGLISEEDQKPFEYACNRLRGLSNKWRQLNPAESLFFSLYILSQIYEGILVDNDRRAAILNRVRLDVDEIKLIPKDRLSELNRAVINVFDNIDNSFNVKSTDDKSIPETESNS